MTGGRKARTTGDTWEARAAEYLVARGISIIECGYQCRLGELDIVGTDGSSLVIVEVRARARSSRQRAIETVGQRKQRRIVSATRHYLMRHADWLSRPIRFDVLAIDGIDGNNPEFLWVRNAFDAT